MTCRLAAVQLRNISSSAALCGKNREHLYGNEPGHHSKNEVRKEAWIWKRKPNRLWPGKSYRRANHLSLDPFKAYNLYTTPDWSFVEPAADPMELRRRPGLLTDDQMYTVDKMRDLCLQTKRAMDFINAKPPQ